MTLKIVLTKDMVAEACPELTKAECEALRDHLYDTTTGDVTKYAIQAAARSLFPYQANPRGSVVRFDTNHYIRSAIKMLQDADAEIGKTRKKSDNLAQIQLDVQCCIHYLNEELGEHHV